MVKFPELDPLEPPHKKLTSEQYLRFCDFCLNNNPQADREWLLGRKTGEEEITVPFRL